MSDQEVLASLESLSPSDHKRKLQDMDTHAINQPPLDLNVMSEPEVDESVIHSNQDPNDESDRKRPRFEDKMNGLDNENIHEAKEVDEDVNEDEVEHLSLDNDQVEATEDLSKEALQIENNEPDTDNHETKSTENPSDENLLLINANLPSGEQEKEPSLEIQQGVVYSETPSHSQILTHKMEVPNNKVGVLIGKAGDTIRYLQYNSGAKIQITRDADVDQYSNIRQVELIGCLESVNKAQKLIKDVIEEADAGGSPSLVARGFATAQSAGSGEQIQILVPNEKVGLIIGKGGETIKSLQTSSGARIQLIPQHLPEGDQSKERTVRVTGDRNQIEVAREMIKEVMNQVRPSPLSGGYSHHQSTHHRPRELTSSGPRHWSPNPAVYDHPYRGAPCPSQNQQYNAPPPLYGNYPLHQPPRPNYVPLWDQRPTTLSTPSHETYNYSQPPPQQVYPYEDIKYPTQHQYPLRPTSQVPPQQPYGLPRPNQPIVDSPYQAPYSQNAPPTQHSYPPYGPTQQAYGQPYGSSNGYSQQMPPVTGQGYVQPVSGYSHTSYPEQQPALAQNNLGYAPPYQAPSDPNYTTGQNSTYQQAYTQPVPAQQTYDQSVQNVSGFASGPGGAVPTTQPSHLQYDTTQYVQR